MTLKPPRAGEILAAVFGALLALSLFLPWYRASEPAAGCPAGSSCPRETVTGFEAFAAVDALLVVVAAGGVALLVLEMTQRTSAVPVAWSALVFLAALVGVGLSLWRTVAPPGDGLEPLFALLGLLACSGVAVACLLSMRNDSPAAPARAGGGAASLPDPLPVPDGTGGGGAR